MGIGGITKQTLAKAKEFYPLVSHGVSLSLGSIDPLNERYLQELKELFTWVNPPWFSDHLCFSSVDNQYFHDLIPLPRTAETVQHVVSRIKQVQDIFQKPFLIENLTQILQCPLDSLTEAEFYTDVLEKADCGLLLDVNNVYVNSQNHNINPMAFLDNIPLVRVVQIHIAGHSQNCEHQDVLIDTHGAPVADPVWDLLAWVLKRSNPCAILLERDQSFPPFQELLSELDRTRMLWTNSQK